MWIRAFIVLSFLLVPFSAVGAEGIAVLEKLEGDVRIYREGEQLKGPLAKGVSLSKGDRIETGADGEVLIKYEDGSVFLLKKLASIELQGSRSVFAKSGRAIFSIIKSAIRSFDVKSETAVMGVKGTLFLVDADGAKVNVFLKEGRLNIGALEGDFVLYGKSEEEAYRRYKEDQAKEFSRYKTELDQGFKKFVKSFDIDSGSAVAIDGNEVVDVPIPDAVLKEFSDFEDLMAGKYDD